MASVYRHGKQVVFTSYNSVLIFELGDEHREPTSFQLPKLAKGTQDDPIKPASGDDCRQVIDDQSKSNSDDASGDKSEENAAADHSPEASVKPATRESDDGIGTDRILTAGFSWNGQYFVICDDHKRLLLWKTGQEWTLVCTRPLVRRATCVTFSRDNTQIIIADKSGDVYSFQVNQSEKEGQLLMGHLSMILDIALSSDNQYLMTCDRDEKVRISNFPNCYNIHSFCLGHTQFVSQLAYFDGTDYVVSGSGDSTLRLWNFRQGKELDVVHCDRDLGVNRAPDDASCTSVAMETDNGHLENTEEPTQDSNLSDDAGCHRVDIKRLSCHQKHRLLAVSFDKLPHVLVYKLNTANEKTHLQLVKHLSLTQEVWDLSLDEDGCLWVLQADNSQPVQLYQCVEDPDGNTQVKSIGVEDSGVAGAVSIVRNLNKHWHFFQPSLNLEGIFSLLHKAKIDNMPEYLKRKEQRLAGKLARPSGGESQNQTELKRQKTS